MKTLSNNHRYLILFVVCSSCFGGIDGFFRLRSVQHPAAPEVFVSAYAPHRRLDEKKLLAVNTIDEFKKVYPLSGPTVFVSSYAPVGRSIDQGELLEAFKTLSSDSTSYERLPRELLECAKGALQFPSVQSVQKELLLDEERKCIAGALRLKNEPRLEEVLMREPNLAKKMKKLDKVKKRLKSSLKKTLIEMAFFRVIFGNRATLSELAGTCMPSFITILTNWVIQKIRVQFQAYRARAHKRRIEAEMCYLDDICRPTPLIG